MKLDCETAKTEKESLHHKVTELSLNKEFVKNTCPKLAAAESRTLDWIKRLSHVTYFKSTCMP